MTIYSRDVLLFLFWNQSFGPCPVLTVTSWPKYRFLKRQVRLSGIPISFRIFQNLLWSTQSKALALSIKQKYMFFWNSLAFSMIQQMLAIWSLVPLPFLKPAWTSGSSHFAYCWRLTSLDSILKSRDIALPKKVRLVKAVVFPLVMYGFES